MSHLYPGRRGSAPLVPDIRLPNELSDLAGMDRLSNRAGHLYPYDQQTRVRSSATVIGLVTGSMKQPHAERLVNRWSGTMSLNRYTV